MLQILQTFTVANYSTHKTVKQVFVRHHSQLAQVQHYQTGETKEGSCRTYLNLIAAKALVDHLPLAYQLANKLQNNQSDKMYNIICLMFQIWFTFSHMVAANDHE